MSNTATIRRSRFADENSSDTGLCHLPKSTAPILRTNGICPYFTMFPLAFPFHRLSRAGTGEWVLDPFCGRGTTSFAARLRGLRSVGIDSNPVAAAIAAAKLVDVESVDVTGLAASILSDGRGPKDVPDGRFWRLCYSSGTLEDICRIRERLLLKRSTKTEVALRALMLGILHGPKRLGAPTYLSNQMPRTYATKPKPAIAYWKKHGMKPQRVDVLDAIHRRAEFVFCETPPATGGRVYLGDSRSLNLRQIGGPFDWIVTSPPYFGMRSYWPDQWLRNWFLGGPPDVEYCHDRQISHASKTDFVNDLACVWRRVAAACAPQAKMIIRFGAIPSTYVDPAALLKRSLHEADCGWRALTIKKAGRASSGKRQSEQFNPATRAAVDEIDLYAVLEN